MDIVVHFAVSSNFGEEQAYGGDADPWQRGQCVFDLPANLILGEEIVHFHFKLNVKCR